jgi:chromosomal replication initiation ATPase DnaA
MTKQALINTVILKTVEVFGEFDKVSRKQSHRETRQIIMYLLLNRFKLYRFTQSEVGEIFGFDPANARHAARRIKDLITYDKMLNDNIKTIETNIRDTIKLN